MSINIKNIKKALSTWARTNSGLEYAIMADQNSPQPFDSCDLEIDKAFITMRISSISQIGQDYTDKPSDSIGTVSVVGNRNFTVFLQVKGFEALQICSNLRDSLQKLSVQQYFNTYGIVFVNNFDIQNITGLDDTRFIERASMDIMFRTNSEINDIVGTIKDIEIMCTTKSSIGVVVDQRTIVVDTELIL